MSGGVIDGDLFVVGGGDPLLQTTGDQPSQEDPNEPYNDFAKLATAIKAAGITTIHGNVVGDESLFDTQRLRAQLARRATSPPARSDRSAPSWSTAASPA